MSSAPTTQLTSQERVNRMFRREAHDRVPRHDNYWNETIQKWQQQGLKGGRDELFAMLGSDFRGVGGSWPAPFPGYQKIVREDEKTQDYVDNWGKTVRYWKGQSGTPEHLAFGCETRAIWEQTYKPAYVNRTPPLDPAQIKANFKAGREADKWCFLTGLESFEGTRALMGDEITMIAMAEDPDWVVDVSRTYTDALIAGLDAAMETGITPDGLWIYGDMAYNHGTFCSPGMYRELIWPDHKRLVDWAHERGMWFIFHTDGDIRDVLDHYVDAGFDCVQPLEAKANMDIREMAPRYGDRLAMFGNIDQTVIGTNDREKVEHEVRSKLEAGKACKGYIFHADHSVPPTVDWSTYQYVIELLDTYGLYE